MLDLGLGSFELPPLEALANLDPLPHAYTAASSRRARKLARKLMHLDLPPQRIEVFVRVWAELLEQRRERLLADEKLMTELKARAGLLATRHTHARPDGEH